MCATGAVVAAIAMVILSPGAHAAQCASSNDAVLRITSAHNATGFLITTVNLQRETKIPARAAAFALEVRPKSSLCQLTRLDALEVTLHTPPPTPPPSPGPGYEVIPGIGYYKIHRESKTWDEAKAECEKESAHLLILNSEAEVTAVMELFNRHRNFGGTISWSGYHDRDKEGHYVNVFGEELVATDFARWKSGEPEGAGHNQNCVAVDPNTLELYDSSCSTKLPFTCEQ